MKESEIQNVELPTLFVMDLEHEEVTYAVAARVPGCALWNLLDCRDADGVPLITVVEWPRFIQARSQVDQD
jgi:hypothetical protein